MSGREVMGGLFRSHPKSLAGGRRFSWRIGRVCGPVVLFEGEKEDQTRNNKGGRDQFRLGRMEPEDIIFGIDADRLHKKAFYSIDYQVYGKKRSRHL